MNIPKNSKIFYDFITAITILIIKCVFLLNMVFCDIKRFNDSLHINVNLIVTQ